MSEVGALIENYKAIRSRLVNPPNAVKDAGINLRPNRIPPAPLVIKLPQQVKEYLKTIVTIDEIHVQPKVVSIDAVFRSVSDLYGISVEEMRTSRLRCRGLSHPRQVASYLASKHTRLSSVAIGKYLGQHHTSILHSIYRIEEQMLVDDKLAANIKAIETSLFLGEYD